MVQDYCSHCGLHRILICTQPNILFHGQYEDKYEVHKTYGTLKQSET